MRKQTVKIDSDQKPNQSPYPLPVARATIQLELWNNCVFLTELKQDFIAGKRKPSKTWTNICYFIQTHNAVAKTLLDSIKDREIDDLTRAVEEIKKELKIKHVS